MKSSFFSKLLNKFKPAKDFVFFIVLDAVRSDIFLELLDKFPLMSDHFQVLTAVAPSSWTCPSIVSILTGKYPHSHGVRQYGDRIRESELTLPQLFNAAGYDTQLFSNNIWSFSPVSNIDQQFNRAFSTATTPYNKEEMIANIISLLPADLPVTEVAHQWYDLSSRLPDGVSSERGSDIALILHVLHAIKKKQIKSEKTFVMLHLMGAHLPYSPDRRILSRLGIDFPDGQWRQIQEFTAALNEDHFFRFNSNSSTYSDKEISWIQGLYKAEIFRQLEFLEYFLYKLKEANIVNNSLLIITSDHGEMLGEHNIFGHGIGIYEPVVKVPLLISAKDFKNFYNIKGPLDLTQLFFLIAVMMKLTYKNDILFVFKSKSQRPIYPHFIHSVSLITNDEPFLTLNVAENQLSDNDISKVRQYFSNNGQAEFNFKNNNIFYIVERHQDWSKSTVFHGKNGRFYQDCSALNAQAGFIVDDRLIDTNTDIEVKYFDDNKETFYLYVYDPFERTFVEIGDLPSTNTGIWTSARFKISNKIVDKFKAYNHKIQECNDRINEILNNDNNELLIAATEIQSVKTLTEGILIRNPDADHQSAAFLSYQAIYEGSKKFIRSSKNTMECYDIVNDPTESDDLMPQFSEDEISRIRNQFDIMLGTCQSEKMFRNKCTVAEIKEDNEDDDAIIARLKLLGYM